MSWLICRPTARQLLKHEFLKKAKDKAYLLKTLLSDGSSVKPQKVGCSVQKPPWHSGLFTVLYHISEKVSERESE